MFFYPSVLVAARPDDYNGFSMPVPLRAAEPNLIENEEVTNGRSFVCDQCGDTFRGIPGGAGLLLWTRGDEVRFEEPPLCEECASRLTFGAYSKWERESDEDG